MIKLTESQIDRLVWNRRKLACSGLTLWGLVFFLPQGWGCGLFSGFMLLSLALYGFCFRRWRSESGLWMLACLLAILLGPCWIFFEYLCWKGLFQRPLVILLRMPPDWGQLRIFVDGLVSLFLISLSVRFAFSVTIENWRRTRQVQRARSSDVFDRK